MSFDWRCFVNFEHYCCNQINRSALDNKTAQCGIIPPILIHPAFAQLITIIKKLCFHIRFDYYWLFRVLRHTAPLRSDQSWPLNCTPFNEMEWLRKKIKDNGRFWLACQRGVRCVKTRAIIHLKCMPEIFVWTPVKWQGCKVSHKSGCPLKKKKKAHTHTHTHSIFALFTV